MGGNRIRESGKLTWRNGIPWKPSGTGCQLLIVNVVYKNHIEIQRG